jgi:exopolysaccharide production protein ExoQ
MTEPISGLASGTVGLLIMAFFLAGPVLALAPLGMTPLLIASAALASLTERIKNGAWPKPPSQLVALFLFMLIWCALTLFWDLSVHGGARKLVDLAVVVAALLALLALGRRAAPVQQRRLALALIAGIVVGLGLEAVETGFDFPLYRAIMGNSDPRLADMVESKRAIDALPLLVWPASLALAQLTKAWLGIVFAALFAVACFKWTASSATLGMAASLVVLAFAFASVKAVRLALLGATVLAFLLIVPLAILAYDKGGTTAAFLKRSAQHRVEIWHFAAEKALERPLFGYGFNASRNVPNGDAVSAFLEAGKPIIPLHPHDAFLQIWLELGAVGVALAIILLAVALRATARWPHRSTRFALAGYAAAMIIAGLAFGIWQTWWMATLAFSAVAFATLSREPDHA